MGLKSVKERLSLTSVLTATVLKQNTSLTNFTVTVIEKELLLYKLEMIGSVFV